MKRILALLIVLAMASVASAASIDIAVNGLAYTGDDVYGSDIITIILMDDGSDGSATQTLGSSYINVGIADSWSHTFYATPMGGWTFVAAGDGYTSSGTGMWIGGSLPQDGEVFVHEFHVPYDLEFSTEILVEYDIIYNRVPGEEQSGSILLHVAPEPTTIGLLGLGALSLLRRRRKA